MGICFSACAVRDKTISDMRADPPLVWRLVSPDDDSPYLNEIGFGRRASLLDRVLGRKKESPVMRTLSFTEPELEMLDLDKSWDGLNACLSDRAPDAPQFFEGSGRIGKIEVGYGPALFHMSDTMRTIADAYLSVSEDDLLGAFNRIDMGKRYLGDFWARRDEDAKSCLLENFAALRAFLRHVVDHGLGVVIQYT